MFVDTLISSTEIPKHITLVCFVSGCKGICDYCYNRTLWNPKYKGRDYSVQEVLDIIQQSNSKYKLITAVSVTGGEPLVKANQIENFFQVLKKSDVTIYNNLDTSLTQGFITDKLLDVIDRISISPKSYWYQDVDHVIPNLEKISDLDLDVEFRIVLTKSNFYKIKDIFTSSRFSDIRTLEPKLIRMSCAVETKENLDFFVPLTFSEYENLFFEFQSLFYEIYGDVNVINSTNFQ